MSSIDLSDNDLKLIFAILTQEKFKIGDLSAIAPIVVKVQQYLKEKEDSASKTDKRLTKLASIKTKKP